VCRKSLPTPLPDVEASTVTVVGQHSSGDYSVEFKNQNGGFSSTWPHWAFELAKAALLSQQCSAAEALQAVTRSGGCARRRPQSGSSEF
jgi:hypothetical protein